MNGRRRVVVDTDAGTAPDDLLALALLAGRDDLDLVGVTTVHGDTALRARIVRALLAGCGRPDVPVVAGVRKGPHAPPPWSTGREGEVWARYLPDALPGDEDDEGAARFLAETVAADPGGVDVVVIGPMSNLALALDVDGERFRQVRHVWAMSGDFSGGARYGPPEYNLSSDEEAFGDASTLPLTLTGFDITSRVPTTSADVARIAAAGPTGALVAREIESWWEHEHVGPVFHDPVALLPLLRPDLVRLSEPGQVVTKESGAARHRVHPRGTACVAIDVDAAAAAAWVVDGVVTGLSRGA